MELWDGGSHVTTTPWNDGMGEPQPHGMMGWGTINPWNYGMAEPQPHGIMGWRKHKPMELWDGGVM